jgi:glycosyltransferase involved in cell wall biosynthesis
VPFIRKGRFVVTVHDIAFHFFPEIYSKSARRYHNFAVKSAISFARKIIVPSQATKLDLVKYYKAKPSQIEVVHHGVDLTRFKPATQKEVDLPLDIKQPYILFIGRIESKKNIKTLIQAYALLRQEAKITHQLVLAGKPGFGYDEIEAEIQKLPPNINQDIIETGYISDQMYTTLLQQADIFVYPSLYEGFGLPVLEAMAAGVPVIASNTSSLPEIVGQAGILANPKKAFDFAAALSRIIHHPEEKRALIKKGLVRAQEFTWSKATKQTLDILREVGQK